MSRSCIHVDYHQTTRIFVLSSNLLESNQFQVGRCRQILVPISILELLTILSVAADRKSSIATVCIHKFDQARNICYNMMYLSIFALSSFLSFANTVVHVSGSYYSGHDSEEGSAACAAHSPCAHLAGECCPNADGTRLACCDEPAIDYCSAYTGCLTAGLEGDCCPTLDDTELDCCDSPLTSVRACSRYHSCVGLAGDCCPSPDGTYLDCCKEGLVARCSAHPRCESLAGDCCPTMDGVFLACCLE